ncbi:protein Red [Planococcus citri]|uniref:protein Red n=1 Tax=Planococcus citri TaxID=170843 RepID=UPI0031F8DCC5
MPKPEKTHQEDEGDKSHRLTNADFRKLLMTPRTTPATMPTMVSNSATANKPQEILKTIPKTEGEDKAERRRKKKIFYAKLKKQEDDKMAELAEKYRDRAKERRDGQNPDYQVEDPLSVASGYRAVAPDVKSGMDAAERRRQMIQESKFLGGDMEHTHLVKGLDYALLQKVRSEIQVKELEQEEEMEQIVSKPVKKEKKKDENEIQFKTRLGRNIYRVALGSKTIERNPMFAPGRMAYVIELQDDMIDTDIPTTVIRSKADVPSLEEKPMLTTNDIVINKLAQILSYLRQGPKHSRKARRRERLQAGEDMIFPDVGDYVPSTDKRSDDKKKTSNYFSDTKSNEPRSSYKEEKAVSKSQSSSNHESKAAGLLSKLAAEPTGYAECYPGLEEMQDAVEDSDDEVDYTKMDLGNKKGPIGRWDFDTQEEYSNYMNSKEALPKAAFQYGVKMADGRRTRKYNKEKNERAELDREWNKIQNIIQKRKAPHSDGMPQFKMPRY